MINSLQQVLGGVLLLGSRGLTTLLPGGERVIIDRARITAVVTVEIIGRASGGLIVLMDTTGRLDFNDAATIPTLIHTLTLRIEMMKNAQPIPSNTMDGIFSVEESRHIRDIIALGIGDT